MTPEEFAKRMEEIKNNDHDPERKRTEVDDLFCELLKSIGYSKGIEIFDEIILW